MRIARAVSRDALAGHVAGALGERQLHAVDPGIRRGDRLRRRGLLRDQSGELVGVGFVREHRGEELLAALEQSGVLAGLDPQLGDVGLHLGDLPLHSGDVAVHRVDRAEGGESGPGQQNKGGQHGRHLDSRADREAAQALAVVQKNIAGLEDVAELRSKASVGRLYVARHHCPRSAPPDRCGHAWRPL